MGITRQQDVPDRLEALLFEPSKTPPIPSQSVRLESTPPEFGRLYAALERETAALVDIASEAADTRPFVLGVCSSVRGEGKTTVALHLALTITRDTFKRVCLMDLSLTDDGVAGRLGLTGTGGLVPAMEDECDRIPTLRIGGVDSLVVIPAGRPARQPRKLARSPRVAQMIASARDAFDIVVVDMPSVDSDNALPLARHMDRIVMVARSGATPSDIVAASLDALGRDRVAGLVMNRVQSSLPSWLRRRFERG